MQKISLPDDRFRAARGYVVKKIYVNGKFLSQAITGTQRYAREVLNGVDKLLSEDEYRNINIEVLIPKSARSIPRFKNLLVRTVGTTNGTVWEQLELPRYCRGQILLTLSGGAPILHPRNVITIHDAAVFAAPSGYSLAYRLWYRNLYRRMAQKAEYVLTNSNFSKSEIVKWCGATPEKISVTYLGSDHFSAVDSDSTALAKFGLSGAYVLAVSSHNPNKNFARIGVALSHLKEAGLDVVVAGGSDSRVYRNGGRPSNVIRTLGYVSDPELKALYENAACFVFASLYEGFGLPPLEAISAGCPIVVSRTASLPEIFEGVGVFCDPYSPNDIANAVQQALQSPPATADQLRAFANKFNWGKCARETFDILNRI